MPDKKVLLWSSAVILGIGAAFAGPFLVAKLNSRQTTLGDGFGAQRVEVFPEPETCEYMLVVARRAERQSEEDPIPHRNSLVAFYEREKSGWQRVTDPLAIRSETTALNKSKTYEEMSSPGEHTYGYTSVPFGVFTLSEGVWRDGETPAYLISDWGCFDGRIGLKEPQVLRSLVVSRNAETGELTGSEQIIRTSLEKRGSWIHYTRTERWSHGDSNGCMNLFRPLDHDGKTYPYDIFLSWFSQRKLEPGPDGDIVPLVVVPFEYIQAEDSADELMNELPEGFIREALSLQGLNLEVPS